MSESAAGSTWVGARVPRREDGRLLTGRGRYTADIHPAGLLHASFVRAPVASARLRGIDASAARTMQGVVAVEDAASLALRPLVAELHREGFVAIPMPIFAHERMRYVGEPVAVAVASDAYAAEDAAEAVEIDFEDEEPIVTMAQALEAGARLVHDELPGNAFIDATLFGDPEMRAAFDAADTVVSCDCTSSRLSAGPMEGHVCLAEWIDRDGQLVVHTSTQVPHQTRTGIAIALGIPEREVRVIAPDVGGGFGLKCLVSREEIAVAALAHKLRRPVAWAADRQENLSAAWHSREQEYHLEGAFASDGALLGLVADVKCDVGAYSAYPFTNCVEPMMAATEMPGPYRVPRYGVRARGIATNKSPFGAFRGVSRPQFVLAMERLMDKAAVALGLDPLDVRRRNLIATEDFPYRGVNGMTYDLGSYRECLDLCAGRLGEEGWYELRETAASQGRRVGVGVICFNERTAYGTPTLAQRQMAVTPGYDISRATMDPSGTVVVTTGTCSQGQGHETTMAQIAADELGLRPEDVQVRQGDTDLVDYGWGTFGSRGIVIGGGAVRRAASELADKLRAIAGHVLEASPEDIRLEGGRAAVAGSPSTAIPISELARLAYFESQGLPPELDAGLHGDGFYDPPGTFSNAAHGAVVELDEGTGAVSILRYVVAEDCGVIVNPMVVDGQVRGGVAQGIAAALYERHVYDESGQLLTASFMDYLMPTAAEIPEIEVLHIETPSPVTNTGAKGMGEGGTIGAPAAVVSAINDALRDKGADLADLPIRPEDIVVALDGDLAATGGAA